MAIDLSKELDFLTVQEAARRLRCTERTIRQKISDGYIKAYRNGKRLLIQKQDLRDYIGCRIVR